MYACPFKYICTQCFDGRGVSGDINGSVLAVGVIPWCRFGVNVPGFSGKLLGRRNFEDFFSTEVVAFGGAD